MNVEEVDPKVTLGGTVPGEVYRRGDRLLLRTTNRICGPKDSEAKATFVDLYTGSTFTWRLGDTTSENAVYIPVQAKVVVG